MKKISIIVVCCIFLGASACTYRTCPTYAKAPAEKQEVKKDKEDV